MVTFIVRVWTPADRASAGLLGLHGVVHNAATGSELRFASDEELTDALRAMLAARVEVGGPGAG